MKSKRRFKKKVTVRQEYYYPTAEAITHKERQADSIAKIQCPECKGELYIGPQFFAKAGVQPDPESMNLVVLHCLQCNKVCRIEKLEQEGGNDGRQD